MSDVEQSNSPQRSVALLVVHGIGDQDRGKTRQKVIDGLVRVYGNDLANHGPDKNGVVTLQLPMKGGWCRVRLYEVFWADKLQKSERGSFELDDIGAVAWYPFINLKERRYLSEHRKPLHVLLGTPILVTLATLFWFGYVGFAYITDSFQRNRSDHRSWVDRQLDMSVGDIFTYVKSMRGAIHVNSARFDAAEHILSEFRKTLRKANNDPDVDEIQVLAHSLGTVIAFHGLTEQQPATVVKTLSKEERPIVMTHKPVTALLTIGSPLMKIMFFWPELVAQHIALNSASEPQRAVPLWTNFYNFFDRVSGRLKGLSSQIKISDQAIWAGGALTSHTIYETNKSFLGHLTFSLTGTEAKPRVPWWKVAWQVIWSPIETVFALIVFPLLIVLGVAFVIFVNGVLLMFVVWATKKVGMTTVSMLLSDWGLLGIMCLLLIWLMWMGRSLAKTRRGTTAKAIVPNEHLPLFLEATGEAVQEGFEEKQMEEVTRTLLDKRRSEFTFPVKAGGKPGQLDLNVRKYRDQFFFTFSGDKRVVDSVRWALRAAWKRLLEE